MQGISLLLNKYKNLAYVTPITNISHNTVNGIYSKYMYMNKILTINSIQIRKKYISMELNGDKCTRINESLVTIVLTLNHYLTIFDISQFCLILMVKKAYKHSSSPH